MTWQINNNKQQTHTAKRALTHTYRYKTTRTLNPLTSSHATYNNNKINKTLNQHKTTKATTLVDILLFLQYFPSSLRIWTNQPTNRGRNIKTTCNNYEIICSSASASSSSSSFATKQNKNHNNFLFLANILFCCFLLLRHPKYFSMSDESESVRECMWLCPRDWVYLMGFISSYGS